MPGCAHVKPRPSLGSMRGLWTKNPTSVRLLTTTHFHLHFHLHESSSGRPRIIFAKPSRPSPPFTALSVGASFSEVPGQTSLRSFRRARSGVMLTSIAKPLHIKHSEQRARNSRDIPFCGGPCKDSWLAPPQIRQNLDPALLEFHAEKVQLPARR